MTPAASAPVPSPVGEARWRGLGEPLASRALVLALLAFATAWNLTKAYHIDDTAYVEIAQWIAGHPLHPMRGRVFWGDEGFTTIDSVNQPHLYLYAMAAWGRLFGWSEVSMHGLLALFALAAIAMMHRLSRIVLPGRPALATTLVVASPAFVVGQNTMVDVPALALWLWFFTLLLGEAGGERATRRYVAAGAVCGAAILVKYTGLVLIPALVLDGLLRRRRAAWYGVAVAMGIVLLWCGFNYWDYGGVHMLTRMDARGFRNVLDPLKWLLCLGAAAPFAFALAGAWLERQSRPLARGAGVALVVLVAAMLPAVAASLGGMIDTAASDVVFATFFLLSGALAIAVALGALPRFRDPLQPTVVARWMLAYWAAAAAAFIVLLAPFVAMRHVLVALPPLVLLALAAVPGGAAAGWRAAAVVTVFAVTCVVASADRWYAGIYREQAARLRASLPASARVWTAGHWGWQWYAAENGMVQIVPGESRVAVGDFIVYPEHVHRQPLPEDITTEILREVPIRPTNWVRAFAAPYAGFYATSAFSQLPWAVHLGPIETFRVLRVVAVRNP